jgi:hypothetical protein
MQAPADTSPNQECHVFLNDNRPRARACASIMKHAIFLPWSRHAHCWLLPTRLHVCKAANSFTAQRHHVPHLMPCRQTKIYVRQNSRAGPTRDPPKPGRLTALEAPPPLPPLPPKSRPMLPRMSIASSGSSGALAKTVGSYTLYGRAPPIAIANTAQLQQQ